MWLGVVIIEVLFEFAVPTRNPFARPHDSITRSTSSASGRYCSPCSSPANPDGPRLAIYVSALHQDCDIIGRSGGERDLHTVGIPAAASRRRGRAARIPATYLESSGGRRGL